MGLLRISEGWGRARPHLGGIDRGYALVAGRTIRDWLLEFNRIWYDRYAIECDRVADLEAGPPMAEPTSLQK